MAERNLIVDRMRLSYEGLFSVPELYKVIDTWFREKGYDKREKKNIERVTADGKYIELVLEPWKKITDYAKNVIQIRMIMTDIKEVEIEKDGIKTKINQGKISMVMDAFFETDYENRWENKALFYFIRTLYDKYFFKPYSMGYQNNLLDDVNHLHATIKSFLNLYRYTERAFTAPGPQVPAP
jgi:hypothetical protein